MTEENSTTELTTRNRSPSPRHVYVHPAPRKPKVSKFTFYTRSFLKHLKDEYWAYIALAGLTCLYTGIMVAVFGFTNIVDPSSGQVEWFGIFLILGGVALILASGIFYHRKARRLRPCICCGVDMDDTPEYPPKNKKRLRFAPNLISPYYEIAKQQAALKSEATMLVTTSPVEELHQGTEMMFADEQEQRADNSEGSSTALITRETNGTKVTLC